jgi:hypothetical protein
MQESCHPRRLGSAPCPTIVQYTLPPSGVKGPATARGGLVAGSVSCFAGIGGRDLERALPLP